jgi:hypothetical protein
LTTTLTAPLHHGAGTSGNTAILRTQEVADPSTGESSRVPFVSAASVRHHLRDALAWRTAELLGATALAKGIIDLLWTGGAVTSTGAEVDLSTARRVDEHYPALGLLGYAAKSDIVGGTLRVSDLMLVCRENAWRLPAGMPDAHTSQRAAAFRSEEFGTRHDVAGSPVARLIETAELAVGGMKTTQMIWSTQVLKAGSILSGQLSLTPSVSLNQRRTLGAALALWAPEGNVHLGAKTAQGYGTATVDLDESTLLWASDCLTWWEQYTTAHAADVTALIHELAG